MELHIKVAQAVHVLNHDTQSGNRVAANQWLVQFQQSDAAWEIATSILTSEHYHPFSSDYEVEFFAAQILKRKIENEGRNLHSGVKDALLNALLLAAKRFSSGPSQLLTQICLALSALVLRAVEHGKPIDKLFYSLQNLQSQDSGNNAVLEMLTVLPETVEDQNNNCHITSLRCYNYEQELLSHTPMVLEFLMHQVEEGSRSHAQPQDRNKKILRCLLSWVRSGCFSEIPPSSLPAHPLFNFVFSSLQVACTFDLAVELIVELVGRHEGLPQIVLYRIRFLTEAILHPALKSGDENVIGGVACLMSEIGQAAPFLIVEASTEALILTDAVLSCVAFPSDDWEIADSTLQFWCCLARHILGLQADNADNKKNLDNCFVPVFAALVDALLLRAQVDDSTYNDNGRMLDLPNSLKQFRINLGELLVDICHLLGSALLIQKIFLGSWMSSDMYIWKEVEAKLFILNAVTEVVLQEGVQFDISILMQLVMTLSSKGSADSRGFMCLVYKTLADVIGSYAKWMLASETNTKPLILFFAAGIPQPICSSSCAFAFRKFCEEAAAMIHEPSNLEILIWIGEGLQEMQLPLEDEDEVVGAITLIICSLTDKKLINSLFARLLSPSYQAIGKIIDKDHGHALRQNPSTYIETISSAGRGIHRVGTVFSYLATHLFPGLVPECTLALLEVFWPVLEKLLLSEHIESVNLSTAACRALALAIQASGQHFGTLLPQVLGSMSANFISFPSHECYIRAASVVVEEFGNRVEHGPLFVSTFDRFTSSASVMGLTSSYICDQEPDLVEAYMNFASSYVRSCTKEVLVASGSLFEISVHKAGICCTALHRAAALSAMSYITCFLEVAFAFMLEPVPNTSERSVQGMVIRVISLNGDGLVSNLVYALLGVSAMSRVHKSATILQQLAATCSLSERTMWKDALCWEIFRRWIYSALQTLPAEYLKQDEVQTLIPTWLKALVAAASDYIESRKCGEESGNHGYMQGKGGRHLKRLLREFADNHRTSPNLT